ncbi:MAG TPA: hypothetical protein VGX46_03145 [Vicinamibacterales bacterium]|nr:hypothetical protein [Vicinamibacterales bacterium]
MTTGAMMVTMLMAAVSAAFGLKGRLHLDEDRSKAAQHVFDDVIWPNAERLTSELGRDVSIAEMPRQTHKLTGVLVGDIDDGLRRRANDEPAAVLDLQAVSIAYRGRCVQVKKHLVALIGKQADTTPVPIVVIEGE